MIHRKTLPFRILCYSCQKEGLSNDSNYIMITDGSGVGACTYFLCKECYVVRAILMAYTKFVKFDIEPVQCNDCKKIIKEGYALGTSFWYAGKPVLKSIFCCKDCMILRGI